MKLKLNDYVLIYLQEFGPSKIPGIRFWAMTLLLVSAGVKLETEEGHVLTIKDCWIEMDDCFSGDCYRSTRARIIITWLNQKKKYFGW